MDWRKRHTARRMRNRSHQWSLRLARSIHGALGVAAPGIGPGSRVAATSWTDKDGNLWLFGGIGSVFWENDDFSEVDQYDLWKFNSSTKEWAWMSGNSTSICSESTSENNLCGEDGIYGTQGIPAVANIPPSRDTWQPAGLTPPEISGFWAGLKRETTFGQGELCNDFWVFEPGASEWAWMGGNAQFGGSGYSCTAITPGTYGVLGTPAAANIPSGRFAAARWTDSNGNLWLFGGLGYASSAGLLEVDLNDFWIYQPVAPIPEPSFELIAAPNPINIGAIGTGAPTITTGTTTVNILVADGFDAPVTLTATTATENGVPDITGSFNPASITGAGSSTLTISVTGAAALIAGPVPFTITGTSGGAFTIHSRHSGCHRHRTNCGSKFFYSNGNIFHSPDRDHHRCFRRRLPQHVHVLHY